MNKNNAIEHHGIKGQKWGKKNGPPYPLSEGEKSVLERKQARLEKSIDRIDKKRDIASVVRNAGVGTVLGGGAGLLATTYVAEMSEAIAASTLETIQAVGLGTLAGAGVTAVGATLTGAALGVVGAIELARLASVDRKLKNG